MAAAMQGAGWAIWSILGFSVLLNDSSRRWRFTQQPASQLPEDICLKIIVWKKYTYLKDILKKRHSQSLV